MANTEIFDRVSRAIVCPPGKNLATAAAMGVPDDLHARISSTRNMSRR